MTKQKFLPGQHVTLGGSVYTVSHLMRSGEDYELYRGALTMSQFEAMSQTWPDICAHEDTLTPIK